MWFIHRTLADNNNTSEKEFCQLKSNWLQFFKPSVHIKYFIIFYLSLDLLAPRAGPELYSFSQLKMWDNIIYEHFIFQSINFILFFFFSLFMIDLPFYRSHFIHSSSSLGSVDMIYWFINFWLYHFVIFFIFFCYLILCAIWIRKIQLINNISHKRGE